MKASHRETRTMITDAKIHVAGHRGLVGSALVANYRAVVDAWALHDNSGDEPVMIEWGER